MQALVDSGALPKQQLAGAVGIGWLPGIDITPAENPDNGPYSNDARRRCVALFQAHGITFSDANAKVVGLANCNDFWFLRDAVAAGGSVLSRAAFQTGVHKLGGSFQSTTVFATFFGPDQHDGVSAIRYWAYNTSCSCMRYTSGSVHAS